MTRFVARLLVLALLPLGVVMILPPTVGGQDIVGQDTLHSVTVVGPYTVSVEAESLPSLQSVQFLIRVEDTETGRPTDDVTVSVLTTWSGGDETGENIALSPNVPGLYAATLKFDPGRWETTVLIEPPGGGSYGADGFVFDVPEPTNNVEAGYVFLGVSVILLVGAAYLVWQIRKAQRQRNVASGDTTS